MTFTCAMIFEIFKTSTQTCHETELNSFLCLVLTSACKFGQDKLLGQA
jgi:hypothetical protein